MGVKDFLGELGVDTSSGVTSGNFSWLQDIAIFLVLAAIVAGFTYWYMSRKTYDKTIIKFREVNGITKRTGVEKAKEIVLPNTSVRAFLLKKSRFYLPRPSIETTENEYWYFIRNDGEWVNVGLGNLNDEQTTLGLKFDHTDMRMANAALKKLVDRSYKKTNWIKEYAPFIGFGLIIIMVAIGGYLVMDKSAEVVGAASANVETFNQITTNLNEILTRLDNIGSSSGVRGVE